MSARGFLHEIYYVSKEVSEGPDPEKHPPDLPGELLNIRLYLKNMYCTCIAHVRHVFAKVRFFKKVIFSKFAKK